jgi:hypothetical protein
MTSYQGVYAFFVEVFLYAVTGSTALAEFIATPQKAVFSDATTKAG